MFVVEIFWNGDSETWAEKLGFDGHVKRATSLYGPFKSQDEAELWIEDRLDDGDVYNMIARELNVSDDLDYINYPSEY